MDVIVDVGSLWMAAVGSLSHKARTEAADLQGGLQPQRNVSFEIALFGPHALLLCSTCCTVRHR